MNLPVLGYRQQGDELRHSADALWLQGEELRNSVRQQEELVRAARDQIELDREVLEAEREEKERTARPILRLRAEGSIGHGDGQREHTFSITNIGAPLRDMLVTIDGKATANGRALFSNGQQINVPVTFKIGGSETRVVRITGLDGTDNRRFWRYDLSQVGNDIEIGLALDGSKNAEL